MQTGTPENGDHHVSHQGFAELSTVCCHLQQEGVEHGTIGSVELITKSCWRELLSDEFSLGNIDHLRYIIYDIMEIAKERVHLNQQHFTKPIKLPDTSQGHYTMQICSKFAR